MNSALRDLETISKAIIKPPYLMQGCGGTISVKTNDDLMVMSASKYRLSQGGENEGFALVNYKNIKMFFDMVDINLDMDYEKISTILIKQNTIELENYKTLQPSGEVAFHSLFKRYTIHSHSAYANILGCGENGEELMNTILSSKGVDCLWIPCISPGFYLAYNIKQSIDQFMNEYNKFPHVVFLENHGLIVTADDIMEAIEIDVITNETIKDYFKI